MSRKQPYTVQRTHQARKIAYWPDVQRVYYTATLTAFMHQWAIYVLACLIPSALTVLQFLAALHRAGKMGYIGTAVAYELLAPQIATATGRPCSVRTLQRGVSALRALGFISLRFWTIPDQTIELGGGRSVRLQGTAKKQTDTGEWKSCQIRIITLTGLACALWDRATKSAADRWVGKLPTPAKLADSSQKDQVENSTKVQVSSTDDQTTTDPRQLKFDNVPSTRQDKGRDTVEVEGRPTSPVPAQAPTPTVEHGALSAPKLPASEGTTEGAEENATKVAPFSGGEKSKSVPIGCSKPRPIFPRGAQNTKAWSIGRTIILIELHKALSAFSTRQADAIYAQAEMEMSRSLPRNWKTAIDWDYFVPRFGDFPPAQRRRVMYSQILPILKNPVAVTPNEPRRFKQGRDPMLPHVSKSLDPYLRSLGKEPPRTKIEDKPVEHARKGDFRGPVGDYLDHLRKKFCSD